MSATARLLSEQILLLVCGSLTHSYSYCRWALNVRNIAPHPCRLRLSIWDHSPRPEQAWDPEKGSLSSVNTDFLYLFLGPVHICLRIELSPTKPPSLMLEEECDIHANSFYVGQHRLLFCFLYVRVSPACTCMHHKHTVPAETTKGHQIL